MRGHSVRGTCIHNLAGALSTKGLQIPARQSSLPGWPELRLSQGSKLDKSEEIQQILITAALRGYKRATVRGIVARAGINQPAISYNFKGKRELYLEVLRASLAPQSNGSGLALQEAERMPPDEALNVLIRMILIPILTSGQSNAIRKMLAWETINPSGRLPDFIAEVGAPYLASARTVTERYLIVSRRQEDLAIARFLAGRTVLLLPLYPARSGFAVGRRQRRGTRASDRRPRLRARPRRPLFLRCLA
jgi:AcrR family transcriptional regulator